ETQQRERKPVPGERAQSCHQRIAEDGKNHRPPAADIVGENAAEHPADAPAEQGEPDDGSRIDWDLRIERRVEQLAQPDADGQNHRESFIAIEHPAEVRGGERPPLYWGESPIPRIGGDCRLHGHPPFLAFMSLLLASWRPRV